MTLLVAKTSSGHEYKVKYLSRADFDSLEIELAEMEMLGLMACSSEYGPSQPLKGGRISGSLHLTIQTAVLIETLGALILLTILVIFLTSVGSLLISTLMVGVAIVAIHGAFHVPADLFLDDQEPSMSSSPLLPSSMPPSFAIATAQTLSLIAGAMSSIDPRPKTERRMHRSPFRSVPFLPCLPCLPLTP